MSIYSPKPVKSPCGRKYQRSGRKRQERSSRYCKELAMQQQPQPPHRVAANQSQCLIATAAFGSELPPSTVLAQLPRSLYPISDIGPAFMNTFNSIYYSFSPQVADFERGHPWLQTMIRTTLYPLFGILMIAERAHRHWEARLAAFWLAPLQAHSLVLSTSGRFLLQNRKAVDSKLLVIMVAVVEPFWQSHYSYSLPCYHLVLPYL